MFDPVTLEFTGFHIVNSQYEELEPNEKGWLWSHQLKLYLGIDQSQLRFFTPEGKLVPTPEEEVQRLAQKLQELGVDPSE